MSWNLSKQYVEHHPDAVWEKSVVLQLETGHASILDGVAAGFWSLMDGKKTLDEIAKVVLSRYDVPQTQLRMDLNNLIQDLAELQLISFKEPTQASSDKIRRPRKARRNSSPRKKNHNR